MKYMVISDIHGNIYNLNKVLDIYRQEHCEKLLILGDLFNYGIDLNKEDIVNRLNLLRNSIIYVKGNCDEYVKGLLFDTPYFTNIIINNKKLFLTHGHIFDKNYLLSTDSNIVLTGHTHISNIDKINNKIFVNPGSISKSRIGENSFSIIDENSITIRNLDNLIINECKIEN